MKNIDLGKTGMKVSVIGLGTWAIGGGPAWGGDMDTQVCIDTICEAEKAGINLLDTAPGYNFGNSEIVVNKGNVEYLDFSFASGKMAKVAKHDA